MVKRKRSSSPDLAVTAHEADIVNDSQASAALSLDVGGDGLVRWGGRSSTTAKEVASTSRIVDDDIGFDTGASGSEDVWVDRFDARLLLSTVPRPPSPPDSIDGWSDLPSDAEDTFFFSQTEKEDFKREKRRRLLDKAHEERLAARRAEDGDDNDTARWASDEEPDETQSKFMRRTAVSLASSQNPTQLEMKILASHGTDDRFAFLRGRWKRSWLAIKEDVRAKEEEETRQSQSSALGLGSYDSSEEETEEPGKEEVPVMDQALRPSGSELDNEKRKQEERRKRARKWKEARSIGEIT